MICLQAPRTADFIRVLLVPLFLFSHSASGQPPRIVNFGGAVRRRFFRIRWLGPLRGGPVLSGGPISPGAASAAPLDPLAHCTERYFTQRTDHFGAFRGARTFQQRYFICQAPGTEPWKPGMSVLLYTGNEANVELYVNATGLMWELAAPQLGAALVFVEHRYFGKSLLPKEAKLTLLTTDQAIADYEAFAYELRRGLLKAHRNQRIGPAKGTALASSSEEDLDVPAVIGLGGSYGGMLCAWLRIKAPWAIDGCLAASAPILSFEGLTPPVDPDFFAKIVTSDTSTDGGAAAGCKERFNESWDAILNTFAIKGGPGTLQSVFRLCKGLEDPWDLIDWVSSALDYMAMGSYPYPSAYILNGMGKLPAYPLRQACTRLVAARNETAVGLLEGVREAAAVFYNTTTPVKCFDLSGGANNETKRDAELWNKLYCSGVFQTFAKLGLPKDMYWNAPWNSSFAQENCFAETGVWADPLWAAEHWVAGGAEHLADKASNVLFSNGGLDPWRGGGVTKNVSGSLTALRIPDVGHHIDLFFSHPDDPLAVRKAREQEVAAMHAWIANASARSAQVVRGVLRTAPRHAMRESGSMNSLAAPAAAGTRKDTSVYV